MSTTDITTARQTLAYGVLPALSAIGFYGSFYLSIENGLCMTLIDIVRGKNTVLPNTSKTIITKWTGIKPIDDYLAFYIAFFLPGSRDRPNMSLQGRHFATQFTAMWALMQLQAHRKENSPWTRASISLTGFIIQTLGAATGVPLFCALHLATSALIKPTILASTSPVSIPRIAAIPTSAFLSIFATITAATLTHNSLNKQRWLNVWQVYYLFSGIFERALAPILSAVEPDLTGQVATARVYAFAEAVSTIFHLLTVAMVMISKFAPGLLGEHYRDVSFVKTFWPRLKLDDAKDMMDARHSFLQWDEVISCASFVLWAAACYGFAAPEKMDVGGVIKLTGQIVGRTVVMGPTAAAAWLLEERDVLLGY